MHKECTQECWCYNGDEKDVKCKEPKNEMTDLALECSKGCFQLQILFWNAINAWGKIFRGCWSIRICSEIRLFLGIFIIINQVKYLWILYNKDSWITRLKLEDQTSFNRKAFYTQFCHSWGGKSTKLYNVNRYTKRFHAFCWVHKRIFLKYLGGLLHKIEI